MIGRRFHYTLPLAVLASLMVTSCGVRATSQPAGPATQPQSTALSATNASGWTVVAREKALEAGPALVTVTVTVKGPANVYGGCVSPVSAIFLGTGGQPVTTPSAAGIHCMAITTIDIPQGQSQTFSVQLHAPSGSGPFLIRTTVNSRPPTQLPDLKFG